MVPWRSRHCCSVTTLGHKNSQPTGRRFEPGRARGKTDVPALLAESHNVVSTQEFSTFDGSSDDPHGRPALPLDWDLGLTAAHW